MALYARQPLLMLSEVFLRRTVFHRITLLCSSCYLVSIEFAIASKTESTPGHGNAQGVTMKIVSLILVVGSTLFLAVNAEPDEERRAGLDVKVKGSLTGVFGVPMGEVFSINALLATNPGNKMTLCNDAFLMSVTHVNGKRLASPVVIPFREHGEGIPIQSDPATSSRQFDKQREMVEDRREFSLIVYETGAYSGAPVFPDHLKKLSSARYFQMRAHYGFCFLSHLVVLEELKPTFQK